MGPIGGNQKPDVAARRLGVARHSETLEEPVVYRQEYGDHGLWVRPAVMFAESVMVDGKAVPRFAPMGLAATDPR